MKADPSERRRAAPRANPEATLRFARIRDHRAIINRIVNPNRESFGFVTKEIHDDFVRRQNADPAGQHLYLVALLEGRIVGFVRAYHRLDGVTTLHELGVAKEHQSAGIGSRLLREVIAQARVQGQGVVMLKTPVELASNRYYPRFGFARIAKVPGRERELNLYVLGLLHAPKAGRSRPRGRIRRAARPTPRPRRLVRRAA